MIYHTTRGDYGDPYDLDDLAETVDRAVQDIKPHLSDFDSIVVTGMSGVIVGVPVSLALGVPLVVLRKVSDDTHAFQRTINEGRLGERALFLDDFISGGTTRTRVKQFVTAQGATLVADYLYRDREYHQVPGGKPTPSWPKDGLPF